MDIYEKLESGKYNNTLDYKADNKAYQKEDARLGDIFKQDLFIEYGVENHPRRHEAYRIAYEKGHSAGYYEIICEFSDIVSLLEPIQKGKALVDKDALTFLQKYFVCPHQGKIPCSDCSDDKICQEARPEETIS